MQSATPNHIAFMPRLPDSVVARDRLVAELENSEVPLVIVRGSSGSGKSTLIASWARLHPSTGIWLSLDPSAGRRLSFWQRVVDTLVDADLAPTGSVLRGIAMSAEMAGELRGILLRAFTTLASPITVVLDDFQEVADVEAHDDIHWLLRSGAKVRFVIATRAATRLEHPDHIAQVSTTVLFPADLTLTPREVEDVASALGAERSSVPAIHAAFGGWALPTRAALLELASGRAGSADEAIATVLATADRLPLDIPSNSDYGRFLIRCSVARRLSPNLAEQLGGANALAFLARLELAGFGSWAGYAGHSEFTIHPLLREQLERQLMSQMPEQVPTLRAAYARDRAENGDVIEAARQFAQIGDYTAIVELARRYYGDIVRLHMDAMAELLQAADRAELRKHPELIAMLLLDAARRPGATRVGILQLATLGVASAQARLGFGEPVERISLLMAMLAGQRLSGHYDAARHTAERITAVASSLDETERRAVAGLLPQALTHVGTTYFYSDQFTAAATSYETALISAQSMHRPWAGLHAESMLALVDAARGDMRSAAVRVNAARQRAVPEGWRGTYSASGHHLAAAYLALERFDSGAARAELDELAAHESTIEHWPIIAHLRAVAASVDGAAYLGLDRLARDIADHASRPPVSRTMLSQLAVTRADLLLADRQPHRAAAALRQLHRDTRAQLTSARLELITGHYALSMDRAAPIAWSGEHPPRARATAMLAVAVAAHRLHQDSAALDAARRAVDLLHASDLRRPLLGFPQADLRELFRELGAEDVLAGVPDILPGPVSEWKLTPAESRVLIALTTTASIDGLAAELHLSSNTVKTHLRQLYRKLGAKSRDEALGVAAMHGIVGGPIPADEATGGRERSRSDR